MSNRSPLTMVEKEHIYLGKMEGKGLKELANKVGCSIETARKWWRVGRDKGLEGLHSSRRGRGKSGYLSQFEPRVVQQALNHKQTHPGWGAQRVLVELRLETGLCEFRLPSRSRLSEYFKATCPECVAKRKPASEPLPSPPMAAATHEIWQLDSQEKIKLADGEIATVCNIRDPYGAAMIASQAFPVKTKLHWRKLTWEEVRQVLRKAFSEWQTMPDGLLTDNELGLAGGPNDPFPGKLTLWVTGLGIKHRFIRPGRPTDQPQVERNHRTLDGWALYDQATVDCTHLQQSLDRERLTYNMYFPTQASNCEGRPPLQAHPELLQPRRPYRPEHELALFDLQRVFDYLASFTFERKVNAAAQVSLGIQMFSLGKPLVRERNLRTVQARLDAVDKQWVFSTDNGETFIRRPVKGITVKTVTGLDPQPMLSPQPIQLSLPFLVA
jgi:hypothetical protein